MSVMRAVVIAFALVAAVGCGNRAPVVEWVRARPDSLPRGGMAYLSVRAYDPEGDTLALHWAVRHGTVAPDSGDSPRYLAPAADVDDTVRVTASDADGLSTVGQVVIHVREGLCGGTREAVIGTSARLLVADSARVYYIEPGGSISEIRWVDVDGVERDTVCVRRHEVRRLCDGGSALYWFERDITSLEPAWRVMTASKGDSAQPATVLEFPGRSATVTDIAVSAAYVHVAWLENVADTAYAARVTSYPRSGGPAQERFAAVRPKAEATVVRRLVAHEGELFFLVTSNDPDQVAVMKVPATGAAVRLVGPELLAPGTLAADDGLAAAGSDVFWSEQAAGRIGRVGRDGSGAGFIVPAGGDAQGVTMVAASAGFGDAGPRLFWAVPNDLRGMIVRTGSVVRDLDRGTGSILGFAPNALYLFYVQDDGGAQGRMFRLLIP
ncbi:MAG: hypothetical protein R6X12_02975 [bacterium]